MVVAVVGLCRSSWKSSASWRFFRYLRPAAGLDRRVRGPKLVAADEGVDLVHIHAHLLSKLRRREDGRVRVAGFADGFPITAELRGEALDRVAE